MDRQKDRTLKDECPGSAQYWLRMEKSLQRAKRLGQSRNEAQPQLRLVVKVKPDAVRTALHRDLECRSGNYGRLAAVRQETARVNTNILGISELKWTGTGELNSDDHYIHNCGQEFLCRGLIVNKESPKRSWLQSQK